MSRTPEAPNNQEFEKKGLYAEYKVRGVARPEWVRKKEQEELPGVTWNQEAFCFDLERRGILGPEEEITLPGFYAKYTIRNNGNVVCVELEPDSDAYYPAKGRTSATLKPPSLLKRLLTRLVNEYYKRRFGKERIAPPDPESNFSTYVWESKTAWEGKDPDAALFYDSIIVSCFKPDKGEEPTSISQGFSPELQTLIEKSLSQMDQEDLEKYIKDLTKRIELSQN